VIPAARLTAFLTEATALIKAISSMAFWTKESRRATALTEVCIAFITEARKAIDTVCLVAIFAQVQTTMIALCLVTSAAMPVFVGTQDHLAVFTVEREPTVLTVGDVALSTNIRWATHFTVFLAATRAPWTHWFANITIPRTTLVAMNDRTLLAFQRKNATPQFVTRIALACTTGASFGLAQLATTGCALALENTASA
jgi:hypothetical protein